MSLSRTDVKVVFKFADSQYYNKDALKTKISSEPVKRGDRGFTPDPQPGLTRTDEALKKARDELFTVAGGDRSDKPNVMVVLTDGKPNPMNKFDNIIGQLTKDFKVKHFYICVIVSREARFLQYPKILLNCPLCCHYPVTLLNYFGDLEVCTG